jgi:predicted ATPase/DNA-binding XRE family transcriptional regulator
MSGRVSAFGAALKRFRLAAGLTHEALAERAVLSARTISDLERGVAQAPRRQTLALLARGLRLTPEQRQVLEASARPAATRERAGRRRHTLPAPVTSFVGRERETDELRVLLRRAETRLVTLTGSPGAGKSRLAIHVAEGMLDEFEDGVLFVALAPVADAGEIVASIAQALDLGPTPEAGLGDLVLETLRERRVLLLLDNFEHVLAGAPVLAHLLASCAGVKALVTSRAALRLSGEQEFPVAPLPVPDPDAPVGELARYPSVALFVDRARLARPDFGLTSRNAAAVAGICVRLDGLPLALVLAAARVKLLPPGALLSRLTAPHGSPLRLLTGGARDLPTRQQTLRGTIAWSYGLLTDAEQRLYRRLAVFVGGCSVEAAERVCADSSDGGDVLDGLASLVDKSLLAQEESPDGEARFAMLETIREFGLEQLAASGEAAAVRARHTAYFLNMVETAGPVLLGAPGLRLRLAAEQDNIRAALRSLVEQG